MNSPHLGIYIVAKTKLHRRKTNPPFAPPKEQLIYNPSSLARIRRADVADLETGIITTQSVHF